jgi:pilus assembly protein CpaB
VAAGVGCVMLLMPMLNSDRNSYNFGDDKVPVVVAASHLQAAQSISENMVRLVGMPPELVPPGAFNRIESVTGRVLRSNVAPQMAVVEDILAPEGRRAGLEGLIDDGFRAKTIKVDEWSAVAHFVKPGSRVDVLAAVRDDNTRRPVPKTILKNVKVLATGKMLNEQDKGRKVDGENVIPERSVTLMLKPREVEILVMHEAAQGRLSLALRSGSDEGDSEKEYGEFLEQQLKGSAEVSNDPPHRFNTWVGQGQTFDVVTYQKVEGVWQRQGEQPAPQDTDQNSQRRLPTLRTAPGQPGEDSGDPEKAKLTSGEQIPTDGEPGL